MSLFDIWKIASMILKSYLPMRLKMWWSILIIRWLISLIERVIPKTIWIEWLWLKTIFLMLGIRRKVYWREKINPNPRVRRRARPLWRHHRPLAITQWQWRRYILRTRTLIWSLISCWGLKRVLIVHWICHCCTPLIKILVWNVSMR